MARPKTILLLTITYQNLSQHYYQYLLKLGYHAHTSRSQYNYIKEFFYWLEQKGRLDISEVTTSELQDYYD